jgi:hypothetical protein
MSNRFGLTNVLMRDVPVEEAIKATSIPNLHFLPSGRCPGRSLGLLDSQRMRDLVKSLKARYDYVFFDSPPIVGVSDASIWPAKSMACCSWCSTASIPAAFRPRQAPHGERRRQHLGVVLNNINILRDDYYYYYHSYYSHYSQTDNARPVRMRNRGPAQIPPRSPLPPRRFPPTPPLATPTGSARVTRWSYPSRAPKTRILKTWWTRPA